MVYMIHKVVKHRFVKHKVVNHNLLVVYESDGMSI